MILAMIDLGTNIFHLRIAKVVPGGTFETLHRESRFVKLAEEGIERIGAAAFQRGLDCLRDYAAILQQHAVAQVRAIGTAALRTASNGTTFVAAVKTQIGLDITLIDGDQEAQYIHRGVEQAIQFGADKKLIMDIGGGSVEFIIADWYTVYWAQSFPVGMAILYGNFHKNDPIQASEIERIENFLTQTLQPLFAALAQHPLSELVGTKGTFDVLVAQFGQEKLGLHGHVLPTKHPALSAFFQKVIAATQAERLQDPAIPDDRIDMIVVGMILIRFILEKTAVARALVSDFDLKEGVLAEMAGSNLGFSGIAVPPH
jgi:exopolyphosphatase / guanosine-5'-triphosphate,3'-diphosphate pyrophosphatase